MRALLGGLGAIRRNLISLPNTRRFGKPPRCDAHMNELPVPCGSWDVYYKDKQSFYNKVLAVGALWFLFSFGMMIYTDSMYMNWGPPYNPSPPSDMVEECDDAD